MCLRNAQAAVEQISQAFFALPARVNHLSDQLIAYHYGGKKKADGISYQ
jgi:hypothetical protein